MKILTTITASLSVLLVSCGDKTNFSAQSRDSGAPVAGTTSSTTPTAPTPRGSSDAEEALSGNIPAAASLPDTQGEASPALPSASQNPVGKQNPTDPIHQDDDLSKSSTQQGQPASSLPETAGNSPAPETKSDQGSKSEPAPTSTMQQQIQTAVAETVMAKQAASGGALSLKQAQGLQAGLTSMVNTMLQGPVQAPAMLGQLVDLIKAVKGGQSAVGSSPSTNGLAAALPALPGLPANLPNIPGIPALADAAVIADLVAALGDLAAAAVDLDVAGVVDALQDLIDLILDLIA